MRDDYTFAPGESIGLDNDRSVEMREGRADIFRGIADRVMRSGNVVALQEFLGEALTGFKLGGSPGRAERSPAALVEFVHYPEHQRQFRSNDCEIGLNLVGHGEQRVQALDVGWNALRLFCDPAISRSAVDLRDARRLPEFPDQRVLASAAADDKDFHTGHSRVGVGE